MAEKESSCENINSKEENKDDIAVFDEDNILKGYWKFVDNDWWFFPDVAYLAKLVYVEGVGYTTEERSKEIWEKRYELWRKNENSIYLDMLTDDVESNGKLVVELEKMDLSDEKAVENDHTSDGVVWEHTGVCWVYDSQIDKQNK